MDSRYELKDPSALLSPSLLIFRDLVQKNLDAMLVMADSAERLRPHVKTHKMPELVMLCERMGIHKHKCATIAEAEMVAAAGGRDVLISYPLVGPNVARLARLVAAFPATVFRITVDDADAARGDFAAMNQPIATLIDLEVGMGRTGIAPGPEAVELYDLIARLPNLEPDGLHAYDGHLQVADLDERRVAARPGQEATLRLRDQLRRRGLPVPRLVFGGTPTFPVHAELDEPEIENSPGTCTLQDVGYASKFADLPFIPAAALLTRVVSRPRRDRLCLDLGHKAVAADPPAGARLTLLADLNPTFLTHSEEHLVVETAAAGDYPVGTTMLALPVHICPTCALHRTAYVIAGGVCVGTWEIAARDRTITI